MSDSDRSLESGIAFALLAAGSSQRFGGAKLAAEVAGRPLIRWAADTATEAGFRTRLLIVARDSAIDYGLAREGWTIVVNPDAASGIASSIRAAAIAGLRHDRLIVGLADMPFVTTEHLRALALADGVVFTSYPSRRKGVPAGFDQDGMMRLALLEGNRGANALDWTGATALPVTSHDELLDVDTESDLARARTLAVQHGR